MLKRITLFIILLMVSSATLSQTFTIRITPEAGFEAIDTIYAEFRDQQPQSILTILNSNPPEAVEYVISNRPTGNLLELMIASPDWSAAQLARMLTVTYPYPVDVTAVKKGLDNHPSLEVVSYDYNIDPVNFIPAIPNNITPTSIDLAFSSFENCQEPAQNPQGLTYDVEVIDNTINLLRIGSGPSFPSIDICFTQPSEFITYELGILPAGNYTVDIYNVFQSTEFPASSNERYLMGQTNLVVRGTQTVAVPAVSMWAIILMALALMIMPILSLHHLKKYNI